MIYLICFGISTALIAFPAKGKRVRAILTFLALMIPSLLAGFRTNSVGTDTGDYPLSLFEIAKSSGYITYLNSSFEHMWVRDFVYDMGIGYATFIYIIAMFFEKYAAVLFFTEFVIVLCVFRAIFISFSHRYRWIAMLLFYFMFYNVTLNNMRQWMAMAILLLAFAHFIKKDKSWIVYALLGLTFHKTAVCGLLVFAVYFVVERIRLRPIKIDTRRYSGKLLMACCIIVLCLIFIMYMGLTRKIMSMIGLSSFLNYFEGKIIFSKGRFLLEMPMVMLIIVNWKDMKQNPIKYFFLTFVLVNLICSQINTMNVLAWRISAYISEFTILVCPYIISLCKKQSKQLIENISVCGYGVLYWMYYFYVQNLHQTLPYVMAQII